MNNQKEEREKIIKDIDRVLAQYSYSEIVVNTLRGVQQSLSGYAASTPSEQGSDGWIDAEKQKPPHNKGVMVFIPEEDFHQTSGMWDISNKWVLLDEYRCPENPVTHWRELYDIPEPYKTERQELYKSVQFPTPPQSVNT